MHAAKVSLALAAVLTVSGWAAYVGVAQVGADAPKDDAAKTDLEALQGPWSAVVVERNGEKAPEEIRKTFKVVIKGDKMTINPDNDNRTSTFKLDPSQKPKAMDNTQDQGPKKGIPLPAIYELDGDTLKICFDNEGVSDKRPTEFKTTPKSGLSLFVLRRQPAGKAEENPKQAQEAQQQATTEQKVLVRDEATGKQLDAIQRVRKVAGKSLVEFLLVDDLYHQIGTHSIGVTVVPADATLRAQLGLPPEQGLVVTNVDLNSPASEAGVAQHDVLLRLSGDPLTNPDDLSKQVDAVGENPIGLEAIRQGKLLKLRLTPRPTARLALKFQDAELSLRVKPRFWIGVELQEGAGADDALRAQLKLPQGQGVAVNNVYELSPAAKAGIKKHDVLLLLGDKPFCNAEAFRENLQEVGEKPVAIKLIREGKTITVEVTPQKHQERTQPVFSSLVYTPEGRQLAVELIRPAAIPVEGEWKTKIAVDKDLPYARLQELIDQVKDVQKKLEALSEDWKKKEPPSAEPTEKK